MDAVPRRLRLHVPPRRQWSSQFGLASRRLHSMGTFLTARAWNEATKARRDPYSSRAPSMIAWLSRAHLGDAGPTLHGRLVPNADSPPTPSELARSPPSPPD